MDVFLILFWASLVIMAIGVLLLIAGGISFQWRALNNKPAWDGHTRPLLAWGIVVFIIGIIAFTPAVYHMYTAVA